MGQGCLNIDNSATYRRFFDFQRDPPDPLPRQPLQGLWGWEWGRVTHGGDQAVVSGDERR
jgi:hypothetical protein